MLRSIAGIACVLAVTFAMGCGGPAPDPELEAQGIGTIYDAIEQGNLDAVRLIAEEGRWVPGRPVRMDSTLQNRRTELTLAATLGHTHIIEYLVEQGAPVNAPDLRFQTPVMAAEEAGQTHAAELLRRLGGREMSRDEIVHALR